MGRRRPFSWLSSLFLCTLLNGKRHNFKTILMVTEVWVGWQVRREASVTLSTVYRVQSPFCVFVEAIFPCAFCVLAVRSSGQPVWNLRLWNSSREYLQRRVPDNSQLHAKLWMHWHWHLWGLGVFRRPETGQYTVKTTAYFGGYKVSSYNLINGHAWLISLLDM